MPILDVIFPRRREKRLRNLLDNIFYGPPPADLSADQVIAELATLGVHIDEGFGHATISHAALGTTETISGWGSRLDGHALNRLRGVLKKMSHGVGLLSGLPIPDRREAHHA